MNLNHLHNDTIYPRQKLKLKEGRELHVPNNFSSGLTDTVKAAVTVAGGFFVIYIKSHIDLLKLKKAETFVQSKLALESQYKTWRMLLKRY